MAIQNFKIKNGLDIGATTGTPPITTSSTTFVANLNVDKLDNMDASSANTANTVVSRDGNGNFSAGTITASLVGNATTSTTSANCSGNAASSSYSTTISTTLDSATNAAEYITFVNATSGNLVNRVDSKLTYNPSSGTLSATTFSGSLNGNAATASSAAVCTGNSATASRLATARTISFTGDVSGSITFDGSANQNVGLSISSNFATTSYVNTAISTASSNLIQISGSTIRMNLNGAWVQVYPAVYA